MDQRTQTEEGEKIWRGRLFPARSLHLILPNRFAQGPRRISPGPNALKAGGGPRNDPGPDALMETPNHLGAVLFLKIEFLPSLQV